MEKITIEGKRPVEILNNLRNAGVIEEYEVLNHIATNFSVIFKTEQPTFSVSMRVEFIAGDMIYKYKVNNKFTRNMIYRIAGYSCHNFYILDDNGIGAEISEEEMASVFTPYEKPKEGEYYCAILPFIRRTATIKWSNDEDDNQTWNLGLAFKTKEQAEFARERLSKLF